MRIFDLLKEKKLSKAIVLSDTSESLISFLFCSAPDIEGP